jgi:hypothetical protein
VQRVGPTPSPAAQAFVEFLAKMPGQV